MNRDQILPLIGREILLCARKFCRFLNIILVWLRFLLVPVVSALLMGGLAALAYLEVGPAALLRGAYDGRHWKCSSLVAAFSIAFALANWGIAGIIFKYGPERFRVEDRLKLGEWGELIFRMFVALLILTVPVLTAMACHGAAGYQLEDWLTWGVVAVLMFGGYVALKLRRTCLSDKIIEVIPLLKNMTARGYAHLPDRRIFSQLRERYPELSFLLPPSKNSAERKGIGREHVRQALLFLGMGVLLQVLYLQDSESIPAALYVMVAVMGATWIIGFLSFFLAHHRIPVLLVLVLWLGIGGALFHKPYTFRVHETGDRAQLPEAFQVIETPYASLPPNQTDPTHPSILANDGNPEVRRRIAVACVGGGIHSGAWAVEVLTRLQALRGCEDLPKRICALSGTSGGAYGAMQYAHAMYDAAEIDACVMDRRLTPDQKAYLECVREISQLPSLGAVVRSLAYDDLPGYIYPQFSTTDRGRAMEIRWSENADMIDNLMERQSQTKLARINGKKRLDQLDLADWAFSAASGRMPAVLFTAGSEESGRPSIFGSSKVHDWNWNARYQNSAGDCPYRYPDFTVPVTTGARLSASFPYVSPVAAPDVAAFKLHRVEHHMDGGYYDNYGLVALNRWLEDGLREAERRFAAIDAKPVKEAAETKEQHKKNVADWEQRKRAWIRNQQMDQFLVIQIRYKEGNREVTSKEDGFVHQLAAPFHGLYNSRVAGQRLRADEQFDSFTKYWKSQGIDIQNAAFEFVGEAPLSWRLTARDKADLREQGERLEASLPIYESLRKQIGKPGDETTQVGASMTTASGPPQLNSERQRITDLDKLQPFGAAAYVVWKFIRDESAASDDKGKSAATPAESQN